VQRNSAQKWVKGLSSVDNLLSVMHLLDATKAGAGLLNKKMRLGAFSGVTKLIAIVATNSVTLC
jgi:hypothetical protein